MRDNLKIGMATAAALLCTAAVFDRAGADEAGVSFWLPGLFGSLAAVPGQPGWSWTTLYYHTSVSAGGDKVFPRGGRFDAGIDGRGDAFGFGPTYVFATPVFGAQASVSVLAIGGHMDASIDATLTGPRGNTISGNRSDERWMFGDLYPMVNLKWNQGVHNFMWYATGDIPVGAYDASRLANLGIGHGAIDSGFGYTYLNPQTGWEASAVIGFTYNFRNPDTDYRNGIDGHLDWGVSKFVTQQVHVGVVGYLYQQVGCDSGSGATLGCFRSRVAGVGPQIGYLFPFGGMQGYINLKGYGEFAAENRPEGWNVWLTLVISPKAQAATATPKPIHK